MGGVRRFLSWFCKVLFFKSNFWALLKDPLGAFWGLFVCFGGASGRRNLATYWMLLNDCISFPKTFLDALIWQKVPDDVLLGSFDYFASLGSLLSFVSVVPGFSVVAFTFLSGSLASARLPPSGALGGGGVRGAQHGKAGSRKLREPSGEIFFKEWLDTVHLEVVVWGFV